MRTLLVTICTLFFTSVLSHTNELSTEALNLTGVEPNDTIGYVRSSGSCESKGMCSIDIDYPTSGNPAVVNTIRQWIIEQLNENTFLRWNGSIGDASAMCQYLCKKYADENEMSICNISISKGYENAYYVSFIAQGNSGGASQWYWAKGLTIDKRTGKKVDFDQFFQGDRKMLTSIAYKNFKNPPINNEEKAITDAIIGPHEVQFVVEGFHGEFIETVPLSSISNYLSSEGVAIAGTTPHQSENIQPAKKLTYEMFLDIYESMANSKNAHHLPEQAFLDRFGLKLKTTQKEYEYVAIISQDVITDSDNNLKVLGPWYLECFDGENGPHYCMYFKDKTEFGQFISSAMDYGLAQIYAENDYNDEGLWDITVAAKNPVKGQKLRLLTEKQYREFGVIGGFDFDIHFWQNGINLDFDVQFHVPDKHLSFFNAMSFVDYGNVNALYADGYIYRMSIDGTAYWTKGCNIKPHTDSGFDIFDKNLETASIVGLRNNTDNKREISITVFTDKDKDMFLRQLKDLQYKSVSNLHLGNPTSPYFAEIFKTNYTNYDEVMVKTDDNSEGAEIVIGKNTKDMNLDHMTLGIKGTPEQSNDPAEQEIKRNFVLDYSKDWQRVMSLFYQQMINFGFYLGEAPELARGTSVEVKSCNLVSITNVTPTTAKASARIITVEYGTNTFADSFISQLDLVKENGKWVIDDYDNTKSNMMKELLTLHELLDIHSHGSMTYTDKVLISKQFERKGNGWIKGLLYIYFTGKTLTASIETGNHDFEYPAYWYDELKGYTKEDVHVGMVYRTSYKKEGMPIIDFDYVGGGPHHYSIVIHDADQTDRPRGHDLGYAVYKGKMKNQKFNDVEGKLVFYERHLIDDRDARQRMAEPGDYVVGEFVDGHLVQGIWYDSNGQRKGSILIGRQ